MSVLKMHIVGKYKIYFWELSKQAKKVSVNENYSSYLII
jgi:hypothetical protein